MTYIDGPKTVDISSFQGSVNIDQVSAQLHKNGVPWLMMRAIHENGGVPDPVFLGRARAFESNGIHVSGYAFGVGNLPGATLADKLEAIWPIQEGRGHNLDFEDNSKWGLNMTIAQAVDFVNRAHNAHMGGKRWPSVYGHSRFMGVPRNDTLRLCPYKIPTYGTSYVLPPTWQGVGAVAWQYSDGQMRWPVPDAWPRSFPGIGNCDMDALQVSWDKFALSVLGIGGQQDMALDRQKDAATFKLMLDDVEGTPSEEFWTQFAVGIGDATVQGRSHRDNMPNGYEQGYAVGKQIEAGGSGGPHTHSLSGFPAGTGPVQ